MKRTGVIQSEARDLSCNSKGPSACGLGMTVLLDRRAFLAGVALVSVLPLASARATPEAMAAAIKEVVGDNAIREGRVTLDVPPLIENGNAVPLTVSVESPMSEADHVKAIHVFKRGRTRSRMSSMPGSRRRTARR